jgi:CheY-like chemotaxis protein
MDGWSFRAEQRRDPQIAHVPVVVLTATMDAAREGERMGAVAAFQKPPATNKLLELVATHCPKRPG